MLWLVGGGYSCKVLCDLCHPQLINYIYIYIYIYILMLLTHLSYIQIPSEKKNTVTVNNNGVFLHL